MPRSRSLGRARIAHWQGAQYLHTLFYDHLTKAEQRLEQGLCRHALLHARKATAYLGAVETEAVNHGASRWTGYHGESTDPLLGPMVRRARTQLDQLYSELETGCLRR